MVILLYLTHYKITFCAISYLPRSLTWREYVPDSDCALSQAYDQILSLIPETIPERFRIKPVDFTRERKISFPQLISFILSAAASDKESGLNIKMGEFFKAARRSGLLPNAQSCDASSIREARAKIHWQAFEDIFYSAVELADSLWEQQPWHLWHGMRVYGIDGSRYRLPASEAMRKEFDCSSGYGHQGKSHYPQCLVSTAYDVFRRLPVARSIVAYEGSERDEAESILPHMPAGGVILFDRGYPSFGLFLALLAQYAGYFVMRCCAENTFPAVQKFIRSGKKEKLLTITPTLKYLRKCTAEQKAAARPITLRAIRLESPDGTVSVLLTNLLDMQQFSQADISNLYFERYRIEEYYRDEKIVINVERFHTKSPDGVRQELFAAAIVSTIARLLINLTHASSEAGRIEPQFKNAVIAFAHEAFVLTPLAPDNALLIFKELLDQIARVKYYRPLEKRASQPRVCKMPPNKWCHDRAKILLKENQNVLCKP